MRVILFAVLALSGLAHADPPAIAPGLQAKLDAAVTTLRGRWIVPAGSAEGINPGTWGEITVTPTYFVWRHGDGLDRIPKFGGKIIHTKTDYTVFAADSTDLYYAETTGRCDDPDHCKLVHWLYTVPLVGGARRLISKSPNRVMRLWSDDRYLYVGEELFEYPKPGERLVRYRHRDAKRDVLAPDKADEPARVVHDDNDFDYIVERPGDPDRKAAKNIVRVAKRGGARTVLATQTRDFYYVYVYGNWLYWSTSDPLPGDSKVPSEARTQIVYRMAKTGGAVEEVATLPGEVPILHPLVDASGRYIVDAGGGVIKLPD